MRNGVLTRELDARGYDMTGVDSSEEMLGKAYENSAQSGKILYLCQDITEFELYGTVAAAVCTTDTLNHLTDDESVAKVFSLLHNYLDPGGIFIFDVNSEYKFSSVYGQNDYVLEDEGCLLTWQNDYDPENATADFYLTLFEETDGGLWRRTDTEFSEKYHSPEKLTAMLAHCGFEVLSVTDSYTDGSISEKRSVSASPQKGIFYSLRKSIEKSGDMPDFFLYSQSAAAGIFPAAAVTLSYSARKKPCVFYICV